MYNTVFDKLIDVASLLNRVHPKGMDVDSRGANEVRRSASRVVDVRRLAHRRAN